MIKRLESLPRALDRYGQEFFLRSDVQQIMRDANTDQLYSGLRSDGSAIAPPYRPYTIEKKKAKGAPYDRVTLLDEGNYYEGFRVKVYPRRAEMYNVDEKSEALKEKYGNLIEGLSPASLERLKDFMRPFFIDHARKFLLR